jgi:hypothetical protein
MAHRPCRTKPRTPRGAGSQVDICWPWFNAFLRAGCGARNDGGGSAGAAELTGPGKRIHGGRPFRRVPPLHFFWQSSTILWPSGRGGARQGEGRAAGTGRRETAAGEGAGGESCRYIMLTINYLSSRPPGLRGGNGRRRRVAVSSSVVIHIITILDNKLT